MIKGLLGPGTIDKHDNEILSRQKTENNLREKLHKEYQIPLAKIWNTCEARLWELLDQKQKNNLHLPKPETIYAVSTDRVIQ
jgi:hypothetical protein